MTRTEYARKTLVDRARRLLRLVEHDAPVSVLTQEAWSIFRAAVLLDHKAASLAMGETLSAAVFRSAARCVGPFKRYDCEEEVPTETSHPVCASCAEKENEELVALGYKPDPENAS